MLQVSATEDKRIDDWRSEQGDVSAPQLKIGRPRASIEEKRIEKI